jgi:uncharacterized OsmC-like protein
MTTRPSAPSPQVDNLLLPAEPARAYAIYAFREPPTSSGCPASALPSALTDDGIAVLVLDLPDGDAAAVVHAAGLLGRTHRAPELLIGHSAAGPAVLAAAAALTGIRGIVTVASPAPRPPSSARAPVLVLHSPTDPLDGVDHAVSDPHQARRVTRLITAWAEPYLPEPAVAALVDPREAVVVADAGTGRYTQRITAGHHLLTADEPVSVGGADAGPNPYELLLAALGACTSMTLRMYADRKGVPLHRTTVGLRHDRVHAKDCVQTEQRIGMLSRIRREITMEGPLTDEDRQRLVEIADRCPVHRTLSSEIAFETTGARPAPATEPPRQEPTRQE